MGGTGNGWSVEGRLGAAEDGRLHGVTAEGRCHGISRGIGVLIAPGILGIPARPGVLSVQVVPSGRRAVVLVMNRSSVRFRQAAPGQREFFENSALLFVAFMEWLSNSSSAQNHHRRPANYDSA
jgi:hypothetical protein